MLCNHQAEIAIDNIRKNMFKKDQSKCHDVKFVLDNHNARTMILSHTHMRISMLLKFSYF